MITYGCAWYPEHWQEDRWPVDLKLMKDAGMNMVRIAEFAWSRLEPADGKFELDWLERAVALAEQYGIVCVLGTPTAAPPAWLTQAHPEVLSIADNGTQRSHGGRCHFSFSHPTYRRYASRIAEEMAKRFGSNPNVVGWQIDNEYGYSSISYDAVTLELWQQYLREKFGTLDELNERWTAAYWSEEYFDWTQIPLPGRAGHSPNFSLEWRRFVTKTWCSYQHEQVAAIRRHSEPRQFITTNLMGWFDCFDHYDICRELDFASWDNYVPDGHLDFSANGIIHDLTRGFKRKNFWLMETQPGWVCWRPVNRSLDRHAMRAMAWHAVAHGADAVSYWQWRAALGGQEQYHGCILHPDGTPRPLYEEAAELGKDFARVGKLLDGTTPAAEVAILHSYDDRWSVNIQKLHKDFDPALHLTAYYRPLSVKGFGVDVIHPKGSLDAYKLVVAPNLHLQDEELVAQLKRYVASGGHLVLGTRSGFKDAFNTLLPSRQPGALRVTLGGHVEEYFALDTDVDVAGTTKLGKGVRGKAKIWGEWLVVDAKDAEVLLRYGKFNGWLDSQPAAVTRKVGKGRITYVGAWLDEKLMQAVMDWATKVSGAKPALASVPAGVEVARRTGDGKEAVILINHADVAKSVRLPRAMRDMISGKKVSGTLKLAPQQVAVLAAKG